MSKLFTRPAAAAWAFMVAISVTAWIMLTDPAQRVDGPAEPWKQ